MKRKQLNDRKRLEAHLKELYAMKDERLAAGDYPMVLKISSQIASVELALAKIENIAATLGVSEIVAAVREELEKEKREAPSRRIVVVEQRRDVEPITMIEKSPSSMDKQARALESGPVATGEETSVKKPKRKTKIKVVV